MVMTSDEIQIQIFANWPMSHAKRVTRDNKKSPEYRVAAAIRKLRTDTNCPAGKSWPNHVKNEQHMHSAQCTVHSDWEHQNASVTSRNELVWWRSMRKMQIGVTKG